MPEISKRVAAALRFPVVEPVVKLRLTTGNVMRNSPAIVRSDRGIGYVRQGA